MARFVRSRSGAAGVAAGRRDQGYPMPDTDISKCPVEDRNI